ncbi:MAG TPA: ABC transporter permease [Acidimicrobiales bacterium]|nr:ABC transporter permease [Acidimicrobiales bacterium]
MTTTLAPSPAPPSPAARRGRRLTKASTAGVVMGVTGIVDIVGFGLQARPGKAQFGLTLGGASVHLAPLKLPPGPTGILAGVVTVALSALWLARPDLGRWARRGIIVAVGVLFMLSFLCWAAAGKSLSLVGLLQSSVDRSIPIVLGALAGCLCERAGVINIAIEGQLLFGAAAGAVAASASHNRYLGLLAAAAAGGLLALILAVFAIRYAVNQIVVGVVLNVLATGLTGYLYDRALVKYQNTLNSPAVFGRVAIPLLSKIPIAGPVLFDSTIFLYLTYVILVLIQVGLFRTRWGLRVRAVGEHPVAAETVGIRVLAIRYRNVILGGLVAGIGGAYLTIGSVGPFGKDVSSGKGFIALAALIFGRWTPIGALLGALLFGFADAVQNILSVLGTSIPSDFLLMIPYIATIVVVAGMVGRVRPPKADGQPYVKS